MLKSWPTIFKNNSLPPPASGSLIQQQHFWHLWASNVQLSLNKNTEFDDIDKSKQSEFLTTCELKESLEEDSSLDYAVDSAAIDEDKTTDKKTVKGMHGQ
jgi:hypothetical protein